MNITADFSQTLKVIMIQCGQRSGQCEPTNINKELPYIYADTYGDGLVERMSLFSDSLDDYFWSYDNNGLKQAQSRFLRNTDQRELQYRRDI